MHRTVVSSRHQPLVALLFYLVLTSPSVRGTGGDVGILRTHAPPPSRRNSMAPNWTSLQILRNMGSNPDPPLSMVPALTAPPGTTCDFEGPCPWQGTPESGFEVVVAGQTDLEGNPPKVDANGNSEGHFLYVGRSQTEGGNRKEDNYVIYSPEYNRTYGDKCYLKFRFHGFNINRGILSIFSESWGSSTLHERDYSVPHDRWVNIQHFVGRRKKPFKFMLEVLAGDAYPYHAAFDNIEMDSCFQHGPTTRNNNCTDQQFECEPEVCVDKSRVCDVKKDCPNGTDEKQQCDQYVSWNAYCTFKDNMCGWTSNSGDFEWKLREDHVYLEKSSHGVTIGHSGLLTSAPFPPPPRLHGVETSPKFNSCQIRFFYRMPSMSKHQLVVRVVEFPNGNVTEIWTQNAKKLDDWQRQAVPIPALRNRYRVEFMGVVSYERKIHVELTNVSLSPDCFIMSGGNVTSRYVFSTCGARGRRGPTQRLCKTEYWDSGVDVRVDDDGPLAGVQQWTVPKTGTYSVFATGASGGMGFKYPKGSFGAVARGVFQWTEGEVIYLLIGQKGGSASKVLPPVLGSGITGLRQLNAEKSNVTDGSGGGGGGATYVFQLQNETSVYIPLLVAAGGGGQCWNVNQCSVDSNAKDYDPDLLAVNGKSSPDGAGGGGGWKDITIPDTAGQSLFEGALGGRPCKQMGNAAEGGFGGGGGSCRSGGGGGGYAGGNAMTNENQSDNGSGGHSYVASEQYSYTGTGSFYGPGSVVIIPEFDGCGCDHSCVIIELETNSYICTCGENYTLSDDNATCHLVSAVTDSEPFFVELMVLVLLVTTVVVIGIAIVMFFLYQRYRRQTAQMVHQEYVGNPVLQLNRLRQTTSGMVTEYNPNYEFGGSTCTIQDLAEVPRENLTLVMALGQGAFGEVYQGYLSKVPSELGDVPVAIKTLPELSSSQAEMDFLMEALIMSKFTHPNIVKFIGVCFEKLPKFIVLELLPGGDLKSFLREARPKPDKPSPLTMKDLLMLAIDVAKGCHYLEENHFIHRDIAARNCLLTTKDVKRVVKIADFGMARDIYRADYYRKGGKAMLPVKWMPPEAFLDGIFTSKTDVWSFGVLLWEVMSLGYMPYPGRGNQDVMQLVTSGGRLEPPSNCPQPVYHIMSQCWHPVPEERPDFVTILERLGYCLQDQDVTEAPLPVFHRPPSTERDATVMRPADPDNICLQVQRGADAEPQSPASTDYLIPIPSSSYSLCTEKTELQSASSMESVDRLLELDDKVGDLPSNVAGTVVSPLKPQAASSFRAPPGGGGGIVVVKPPASWETSFMQTFAKGQSTPTASQPSPPTWSGEYQSVPTQEEPSPPTAFQFPPGAPRSAIAAIPPPESSPARKSPPSAIARQRPSVKKTVEPPPAGATEARSAPLPLDPSTLTKQHQAQTLPYANVAVADPTRTSVAAAVRSEPYTITAPRGAKSRSDKDATC